MSRTKSSDDGFATVWTAGAIVAILVLVTMIVWLASAIVTRHRATAAADLAALAAAARAVDGTDTACAQASTVATRMGATVESCRLRSADALVEVSLMPRGVLAQFGASAARARAGPVE